MRETKESLLNAIDSAVKKTDKEDVIDVKSIDDSEVIGYGVGGKEVPLVISTNGVHDALAHKMQHDIEFTVANPKCLAKLVKIKDENGNERHKYYVKMGRDGHLFNPWGIYSEGTENQQIRQYGKAVWEYQKVGKKSFNLYLKFLQTRNQAWLFNAERIM